VNSYTFIGAISIRFYHLLRAVAHYSRPNSMNWLLIFPNGSHRSGGADSFRLQWAA